MSAVKNDSHMPRALERSPCPEEHDIARRTAEIDVNAFFQGLYIVASVDCEEQAVSHKDGSPVNRTMTEHSSIASRPGVHSAGFEGVVGVFVL